MTNPILIVGGGPAGLTMAAALTEQGIACRIIDKAPAPSDKSKALVVWCRTLELLAGLGLADAFVRTGRKSFGKNSRGQASEPGSARALFARGCCCERLARLKANPLACAL